MSLGVRKQPDASPPDVLEGLAAAVGRDLELLNPAPAWTLPRADPAGERALDVAIIGAGQSGLGAAFALRLQGVRNVLALDENPEGREGPWIAYARMITLRTPKTLTGLDMGAPSLTFRAFWEAQHGEEGWRALDKIPRLAWMDYLRWYRRVLDLPVRNGVRVTAVEPVGGGLHRLSLDGDRPLYARKVVFATGIQGGGEWSTPEFISTRLDPRLYAHTSQAIDFDALKGRRIGLLGGGASAFDNAQHALSAGAASVEVFMRRAELPRINPIRHMEVSGLIGNFTALDDAAKYRVIDHFLSHSQPPTNDTFGRAAAHPGFSLHLAAPWQSVRQIGDRVEVTTPAGVFAFDFLILATGLKTDLTLRPELAAFAEDILLWRDRHRPPEGEANALLDAHPYLGPAFELRGKTPEADRRLHGLYLFNYAALASLGLSASSISGLKAALPRLAAGIGAQLFLDDRDELLQSFLDYSAPEFLGRWPAD
jgi:cation diffusion facilitator CzcD-associated flavoprotein CzcO